MKGYREWNPRQNLLLPPSLLDWLPKDHAVYFLLDVVEELANERAVRAVAKAEKRLEHTAPRTVRSAW